MARKFGVFISYSHEDKESVCRIVELVRAIRNDLVFLDQDSIQKGKLWEPQLDQALNDSEVVIVFWCRHSANSDYVARECNIAMATKKDILPILLDYTKLEGDLGKYQWIDFRDFFFHGDQTSYTPPARPSFLRRPNVWLIILIVIVFAASPLLIFTRNYSPHLGVSTIFISIALLMFLLFAFYMLKRRMRKSKLATENARIRPDTEIAADEIVRKLNEKIPAAENF